MLFTFLPESLANLISVPNKLFVKKFSAIFGLSSISSSSDVPSFIFSILGF
jgi:hypothetical protein